MACHFLLRLIVLLILSYPSIAQGYLSDSLRQVLAQHPRQDSTHLALLNKLAFSYYQTDQQKMREIAQEAQKLGHKIKETHGEVMAYSYIAISFTNEGDFEKALKYMNRGLNVARKTNNKAALALAYNTLGIIYKRRGSYTQSLRAYIKAAHLVEALKDEKRLAAVYFNIAHIYFQREDYQEALDNQLKAEKIFKANTPSKLGIVYNNLGRSYQALGDSSKAINYYKKALKINQKYNLKGEITYSYLYLGDIYWHRRKSKVAQRFYQSALISAQETKSLTEMVLALNGFARIAMHEKKVQDAKKYLQESDKILRKIQKPDIQIELLRTWAKLDSLNGDYLAALAKYQRFYHLEDSIEQQEKQQRLLGLRENFKVWKQEKENENLRETQASQQETLRWQNYLLLSISIAAFFILLALFLVIYAYRNKTRNNQKLRVLNQQIGEQKNLLEAQSRQLTAAQKALISQNQALEQTVKERTQQLAKQNQQLVDYAFFNAHKVRGPLANLMGLVYLIQHKIEPEQTQHYINLLSQSAKVLDERIREINQLFDPEDDRENVDDK